MEISKIKENLSSGRNWQSYKLIEIVDMLESAMEEVELLEDQVRLLTPRAVDLACSCGGKSLMRVLLCDDCGSIIMPPSH